MDRLSILGLLIGLSAILGGAGWAIWGRALESSCACLRGAGEGLGGGGTYLVWVTWALDSA